MVAAMSSRTRRRIRAVPILAVLVTVFVDPTLVHGQPSVPAIGSSAVIKPGVVLRAGDKVVDLGKVPHIYVVRRAKGDWLWLTSGAISGWARAADVVPFHRAIDETVEALVTRGKARSAVGNSEGALADYNEALRLDPMNQRARLSRAMVWQAWGNLDRAIVDYDWAIGWGLRTVQAYNNRGTAWAQKKDYAKALVDYTYAIQRAPGQIVARLNRGRVWQAMGKMDRALYEYEEATRRDPSSPWGYALQAAICSGVGDPTHRDGPRAVELASKACALGGADDASLCAVRASAHEAAGEPDRAAEWRTRSQEAAAKARGRVASRTAVLPNPEELPTAPTLIVSADDPPAVGPTDLMSRGAESDIGYLSSIPGDYRGYAKAPPTPMAIRPSQPQGSQPGNLAGQQVRPGEDPNVLLLRKQFENDLIELKKQEAASQGRILQP
jgi:hypothetical protein